LKINRAAGLHQPNIEISIHAREPRSPDLRVQYAAPFFPTGAASPSVVTPPLPWAAAGPVPLLIGRRARLSNGWLPYLPLPWPTEVPQ
jgi:hypothetical protein